MYIMINKKLECMNAHQKVRNESNQIKIKYEQTNKKLDQTKQELIETKEEHDECKREKKQAKESIKVRKSENKQYTQSIIVDGCDEYNGLGEKPNNKGKNDISIISSPVKLSFDLSSLLSYSAYNYHSVHVTSEGSLKGIGYNRDGRINATLQKTSIEDLTSVSAFSYRFVTLYMFS